MYKYAAITRKGISKEKNEDRIMIEGNYISDGELQGEAADSMLAVVCDGVGGEAFGEVAAEIASMSFLPLCGTDLSIFDVSSAVSDANKAVIYLQSRDLGHKYMSSTIAGIYISQTKYVVFNAGDTRVYLTDKKNRLTKLSKDHTEAQRLVDRGVINSPDEAPKSMRHTINRYIGGQGDTGASSLRQGSADSTSTFLLCSDGLYNKLSETDLEKCLNMTVSPIEKCRAMVNLAIEHGSADDVSIILVEIN